MPKKFLILCLCMYTFRLMGIHPADTAFFNPIIAHAEGINLERNSVENLSHQLTYPYQTDREKIAAIFTWVALHLNYDIKRINSYRTYQSEQEVLDYVVKTQKGVCLHYCLYFNELCTYANLQSYTVHGYVKQRGQIQSTPHTWNAIKTDSTWYLLDVTWAAGYASNHTFYKEFTPTYFLNSPLEFIKTHMPFDKMWQLTNYPITFDEFAAGARSIDSTFFNFEDTLQTYLSAPPCAQLQHEKRRIEHNGTLNPVIANELHYKEQNIQVCLHNLQANYINTGVAQYEKAVELLNRYILYYNGQFNSPPITDNDLRSLMSDLSTHIRNAKDAYHQVYRISNEIDEVATHNLKALKELEERVNQEKIFITKYLNTSTQSRKALFYQRKFM